jgi:hypothetical protein
MTSVLPFTWSQHPLPRGLKSEYSAMFPLTGGLASLGLSLVQADDRATVDRVEAFTAVLAPVAEVGL